MTSVLLRQQLEGVLTLTLNRPGQLNALTWELMRLLNEALEDASVDPGVRVVVLTGAGRGFCSGGDLRSREQIDPEDPVSVRWSEDPVWKSVGMRAKSTTYAESSPTSSTALSAATRKNSCDFTALWKTSMVACSDRTRLCASAWSIASYPMPSSNRRPRRSRSGWITALPWPTATSSAVSMPRNR